MADESRFACDYLTPPEDGFWAWRDLGDVICWTDGKTIAFREELSEILARVVPIGLPPFGAILLLLAATRDSWDASSSESGMLAGCLRSPKKAWGESPHDLLVDVLEGLANVRRLDPDLRISLDAKVALAELVFEGLAQKISTARETAITDQLYHGPAENITAPVGKRIPPSVGRDMLLRDLRCLKRGLGRVDPARLGMRRATGLDEVPQAADLDLPPAERVRAMLASLVNDDELQGLAKLAHHLMAAVTLPRAVADHDEIQVGGVSDIANRGSLDRLLMSELAYDDLTLAIRVAENEAMYLRRESPPRSPPQQRAVLLETGIRSWGVPRVFATAVALALAATAERNTEVLVYRAKGDGIEPVNLTTRAGLVAHLAALDPDPHPGRALEAWQVAMAKAEHSALPVLVTSEDVVNDKGFQRSLTEYDVPPLHVVTVSRNGMFRLAQRTSRGSKLIREATLDLESLFAEPKRNAPTLIDREWARDLPAILSVEPFPLLMSHNIVPDRVWGVQGRGVLTLTKDQRLMFWEQQNQGGRQITDDVPSGGLWWASRENLTDQPRAVVGSMSPNGVHLLNIDLDRYRCESRRLAIDRGVRAICSHNGVLFAIYPGHVHVLGEETGEVVQSLDLPTGMSWIRDRFFQANPGHRWFALSYDGRTACLEPALDEGAVRCPKLLTLFECDGFDGPMGITMLGDLYSTGTSNLRKVAHGLTGDLRVRMVSRDGRRIVIEPATPRPLDARQVTIDVKTLKVDKHAFQTAAIANPEFRKLLCPRNMRHRFACISVDVRGILVLTSRKQHRLGLGYDARSRQIELKKTIALKSALGKLTFKSVPTPPEVGFRLGCATWNDGSEAFLDSRGLLHLRSSDRSIPEISIVLTDGGVAGWCSDGRLWGDRYFSGDGKLAPSAEVFESVIQFAERLR